MPGHMVEPGAAASSCTVARYELALAAGVIPDAAVWTAWQALAEVHRRLDVAAAARGASPAVPSPDTPEAGGGATPLSDAQIVAVARALSAHAVDAIVIGGLGGYLHGIPVTRTYDADLCVSREPGNIDRLVGALGERGAVLRDPHGGLAVSDVPVGPDLFGPGAQTVIFATDDGPADVVSARTALSLDAPLGFDVVGRV